MTDDVVRVRYQLDLWVHVDPDEDEIVSVHVDDGSLEGPLEVSKWGPQRVEQRVRDRVIELVADDATWPIWIIGFDHN